MSCPESFRATVFLLVSQALENLSFVWSMIKTIVSATLELSVMRTCGWARDTEYWC